VECGTTLDPRIDQELLAVHQEATKLIPALFEGIQMKMKGSLPDDCARVWLAYLAAEVYGNADAAIIAIVHNRGRQAQILERQLFECITKAEYYINNPDEARLEFLALPFRDKKYMDALQVDPTAKKYVACVNAIDVISKTFPEVPEYAKLNDSKERPFAQMLGDMNDPDVRKEYALRYRRKSQTPHGTVVGMFDVLEFSDTGCIVKFDSRLFDPNLSIAEMTIFLLKFLDLLDQYLGTKRWNEIEVLDGRLNEIIKRL